MYSGIVDVAADEPHSLLSIGC